MTLNKHFLLIAFLGLGSSVYAQQYFPEDYSKHSASNIYNEIGTSSDGLDSPVDLAFNPLNLSELWVISMRTEAVGGNTVTYRNVGTSSQQAFLKKDGNSWHFMSLPTALAFGTNGAWGSTPGVLDANHRNGASPPFTGPSLWSSDFNIYAQNAGPGTNGSHLDMLHGSPYSQGMAWESGNKYWLFDGYNGHLARYDFAVDHGPGNSNHDDGKIRRYPEVTLKRNGLTPSHMEIAEDRKWLYINDIGNSRIIRVDITSGVSNGNSTIRPSEVLAENIDMKDAIWETVASSGLNKPCGLAIKGDRLVVTDNATSEIIVYNICNEIQGFPEIARIKVPYNDIMGIEFDSEGKMWFVDKSSKVVVRIDNNQVTKKTDDCTGSFVGVEDEIKVSSPITIYPNPAGENFKLTGGVNEVVKVKVFDLNGKLLTQKEGDLDNVQVTVGQLSSGVYSVDIVTADGNHSVSKLIKK